MASNKLEDLNDLLFNELSRLDKDDIKPEELNHEIERAKAMSAVGNTIIQNANTVIKAAAIYDQRVDNNMVLPHMIGLDEHDNTKD
ncbi:hypothetical protein [Limosilactobacillus antri]|uniref:Phage protein n=1 Tax=Limosilactobacillus antri DSM 16041 TaxID=525309 RepID=C8P901_9LACO|nr:hypothetical protein [Limosilactobacillus antri]EEW53072.1 hypothetical protein HMPREF0494_1795 [Limosilactobacillus antri DSM 16041]KRK60419.1 hypothetical protein FC31_GL001485 [Limosilactobacillus antri DSM 16041]